MLVARGVCGTGWDLVPWAPRPVLGGLAGLVALKEAAIGAGLFQGGGRSS